MLFSRGSFLPSELLARSALSEGNLGSVEATTRVADEHQRSRHHQELCLALSDQQSDVIKAPAKKPR